VTGISIFNFTGPEGARDANALLALSKAIDDRWVDDAYTKLTFQLINSDSSPASTTVPQASTVPATATTTQKSPLMPGIPGLALATSGTGAVIRSRKRD